MPKRKKLPPYVRDINGRWHFAPSPQMRAAGVTGRALGLATDPKRWKAADEAAEEARLMLERAAMPKKQERPAALTVDAVFDLYLSADNSALQRKAEKTLSHVQQAQKALRSILGDIPAEELTLQAVEAWFWPKFDAHPHTTHNVFRNLRMVMNWAKARKAIKDHPLMQCRFPLPGKRLRYLTRAEVAAMRAAAERIGRASIAKFIALGVCIGQRPGDLLALRADMVSADGVIRLTQHKTGAALEIPLLPWARDELAHELAAGGPLIVSESTGAAYALDHLEKVWVKVRAEAVKALPSLADAWAADLRTTCVVYMAEGGATIPHIAAVTGHSLQTVHKILEHYLPRTQALARQGVESIDLGEAAKRRA